MNPAVMIMPRVKFRIELIIVGIVLVSMLGLPMVALTTMTNIPALASDDTLKLYTGSDANENKYEFGYCTWWASKRRAEVGNPIPQHLGDAHYWDDNAFLAGYRVDNIPQQYAIMQTDAGSLGHVAFVESVEPDGSWTISEMNVVGWDILSGRTFKATQAKDYSFIH